MTDKDFTLNTGAKIPAVGLGTWQSPKGEVKAAVVAALKAGYRHVDAAFVYGNENEVGEGLKEAFDAGVCKREDIFVTTKLWCTYHNRPQEALDLSLERLGLDYVDLYLMHWPVPMNPNGNDPVFPTKPDGSRDLWAEHWHHTKTWELMEKLPETGKAKAIGVSNYSVPFLEELVKTATVTPAANQIENHPYLPQPEIVEWCQAKNIHVTAYSPFGSTGSPLFKEDAVVSAAKNRGVSEGTILLSFAVARGINVIPKSVTESRIKDNAKIVDLTKQEVDDLLSISSAKPAKRYVQPPFIKALGGLGFPKNTLVL